MCWSYDNYYLVYSAGRGNSLRVKQVGKMASGVQLDDPQKYAENLRKQLMSDLFEGDDFETDVTPLAEGATLADFLGEGGVLSLQDVDKDLEEFQDHDIIKGILEQGRVVKEYAREIDDKLRTVELESIQDYIQESDNMVALHDQVMGAYRGEEAHSNIAWFGARGGLGVVRTVGCSVGARIHSAGMTAHWRYLPLCGATVLQRQGFGTRLLHIPLCGVVWEHRLLYLQPGKEYSSACLQS